MTVRRIIACFAPGLPRAPQALAQLAREMQADLVGLFIEDAALLRFAALPFAMEVGFPSAERRPIDAAALERALRADADALRRALSSALEPAAVAWTFRVERATPAGAVEAVLAEECAPTLVIPPGGNLRAERRVMRRGDLSAAALQALIAAARPVLVLDE